MQLKGKTALIAGAGRNNGRAIAINFAREGAELILVSRKREDELNEVKKECEKLGAKVLTSLADLSKPEEVNRIVKQGLDHFGKVDVSVSVAGIRRHKDFWDISCEEWLEVFAVNLHSTFYLAKALAPSMMKRKTGNIIALGGLASMTAQPQRALRQPVHSGQSRRPPTPAGPRTKRLGRMPRRRQCGQNGLKVASCLGVPGPRQTVQV